MIIRKATTDDIDAINLLVPCRYAYIQLSVLPDNADGQRFYARHGLKTQMITMECPL